MLIYVMGRPHSGSTILDIALGNSASIESVGELVSGLRFAARGHRCACGETMLDCKYWMAIRAAFDEAGGSSDNSPSWDVFATESFEQAHIKSFMSTLLAPSGSPRLRRLGAANARAAEVIAAATGKAHVLDSSKEPTRALMLLRFCPSARVIHLIRDPRRSLASHYWRFRKQGGYFHFLRRSYRAPSMLVPFMLIATVGWTVGHLSCEIARRFAPGRVFRVRYEDLAATPLDELRRIGDELGLQLDDLLEKLAHDEPLAIGHNVGGNQIRLDHEVTFRPEKGSAHDLPFWLEMMVLALCWPLMLAYGYRLGGYQQDYKSA